MNGNFNLIVKSANDYFGIASIAASGAADITLTIDSSENVGFTAAYDFSQSSLAVVDEVRVHGDTKLIFNSAEQIIATKITGVTDSTTIALTQGADGTETEFLVSTLDTHLYGVDTFELGDNVTLVLDSRTALTNIGDPEITGQGTIVIARGVMTEAELVDYIQGLSYGAEVSIIDTEGADLLALIPSAEILGTAGDDTYEGTSGESIYVFSPVDGAFGSDTVNGFELVYDKIDIAATGLDFADITQEVTQTGLQLTTTQGTIFVAGLTEVLDTQNFKFSDATAPEVTDFSVTVITDVDAGQSVGITLAATDADSAIASAFAYFNTPSGGRLEVAIPITEGVLTSAQTLFGSNVFSEEGIYSLAAISVTDANGNETNMTGAELAAALGTDTIANVFNTAATGDTNIIAGTSGADTLKGTDFDDVIVGREGVDILSGSGGNDAFYYLAGVALADGTHTQDFGIDTITDFNEGDTLNFSNSNWSFGSLDIHYRTNSTEITVGGNTVILDGFTGVLTNIGTYNDPILAVLGEEARFDANHEGDVRPPSYNGIELPATVNLDENTRFYFYIDITDDISGADWVTLKFQHEDGHYFYTQGDDHKGFEGFDSLSEWFIPGTYSLVSVYGEDLENNHFSYNVADIEELGLTQTIEITNSNPDFVNPVINSVTLDQTTVDLGADGTIFATIDATDDLSGVDWVKLRFTGPDGDYFYTYFYPETGLLRELDINPYFTSGTYTVTYASIKDNAGHQPTLSGQALIDAGLNVSFELINPNPDDIAPTLTSVSSGDDLVYVIGVEGPLRIQTTVTEEGAGLNYGFMYLTNEDGYTKTVYLNRSSQNDESFFSVIYADRWSEGTYTLSRVYFYDDAQNQNQYYNPDVYNLDNYTGDNQYELTIDYSFDVVAPLKIEGTVENDLLIGGDGYDQFVMGESFGNDTIESFTVGFDYVDLRATDLAFNEITQTVNADGLLLENGEQSILIKGLTAALSSEYLLTKSGTSASTSDNTAPTLTGLTITNPDIDASDGAYLNVSVVIADAENNGNYARLQFTGPNGEILYHYIYSDDNFSEDLWLNEWTDAGTYTLTQLYVRDANGASTNYYEADLAGLGVATSYTVANSTDDSTGPTLTGFTISDTAIEVGIENVINFTATGTDDLSGVDRYVVYYSTPVGESTTMTLSSTHQFIGGRYFSDWSDAGTYTITQVKAFDVAGNVTIYDTAALTGLSFQTTFEVTDARAEDVAPVLTGLTLNQAYQDSGNNNSDRLIVSFDVDETGSGISYITYSAAGGAGSYSTSFYNGLAYTAYNIGTPGIYTITQVTLNDLAGNSTTYDAAALAAMGLGDMTYRVLGNGTQPGVAVVGTGEIDIITGTAADEVFTLHLGTDTVSFGADWGHDTIADYVQGDDMLDFSDSGFTYADLTINQTSYGLFINDDNGNDLLLQGFEGGLQSGDIVFAATQGTVDADAMIAGILETVIAGEGDDSVTITDASFTSVDGGAGSDTLVISGDGLNGIEGMIDLSGLVNREAVLNFEHIDISDAEEVDTLLLTAGQVIAMTDSGNLMIIDGDAGDTLNSQGEGWIAGGTTIIGGVDYNVYTADGATIHVDPEMTLVLS